MQGMLLREMIDTQLISKEEVYIIAEFCATASTSERKKAISTLKKEFKNTKRDLLYAIKTKLICEHKGDSLKNLMKIYLYELNQLSEIQKITDHIMREIMINFRIMSNTVKDAIENDYGCTSSITTLS